MGSRLFAVVVALTVGAHTPMATMCLVECAPMPQHGAMHCHGDGAATPRASATPDVHACAHADGSEVIVSSAIESKSVGRDTLLMAPMHDVAGVSARPLPSGSARGVRGSPPPRPSARTTPVPLRV